MTLLPFSPAIPFALLRRTFQSKATFSAFSTPSAPPSTKNAYFIAAGLARRPKVSTNHAYSTLYMSDTDGFSCATRVSIRWNSRSCIFGWL